MSIVGSATFIHANTTGSPSHWPTASDGQTWATVHGGGVYLITSNEGTVSGTTAESVAFLGSTLSGDFDITVRLSRSGSTVSATGIVARATSSTTYYKARLKSGNLDILKTISGTGTVLATAAYAVTLGNYDWLRLQVVGTTVQAKAWQDGQDQPLTWMVSATDGSITGTGQYGLVSTLQPSDTSSFDSFTCDNLTNASLIADNPYGFTILAKAPVLKSVLQDIVAIGAAWVRPQTNWSLMEKTDDGSRGSTPSSLLDFVTFNTTPYTADSNWALMDDIVQKCNNQGLRCCLTIQNPPNWHCTQGVNVNTQIPNAADTIAFGKLLAHRYNGSYVNPLTGKTCGTVQAIMFNEDFDPYSAGWPGGTGSSYNPSYTSRDFTPLGSILPTLYPYIKGQLSSCLVGCASALGKRTDATHIGALMTELWNSGVGSNVDFVDYHFYNCAADPTLPNSNLNDPPLADRINAIKAANTAAGHGGKDIWMTEFGYQVTLPGTTPATCDVSLSNQSYYLRKSMDIARGLGVSHFFIWTIGSNDNNSLTQKSGPSKYYQPAYSDIQNYIALHQNPSSAHYALFPPTARRLGTFPGVARRLGQFPITSRRESA